MGNLQTNAKKMYQKFIEGEGGEHKNDSLTNVIKEHSSTIFALDDFRTKIRSYIESNNGNISTIGYELHDELNTLNLPTYKENTGGLTIMIHGIWGMNIHLSNFSYYANNNYFGKLNVVICDRFGLDDTDLGLGFLQSVHQGGFSAWYCL